MAITETSVTTETEHALTESPIPEPGGLAGLLGTGDHKALVGCTSGSPSCSGSWRSA